MRSVRVTTYSRVPDYFEISSRFSLGPQGTQLPYGITRRKKIPHLAGRKTILKELTNASVFIP